MLELWLRVCLNKTYFVETENWKHCSKIIFKYVNSDVRPIFNKKLIKNEICGSMYSTWTVAACEEKKKKMRKRRNGNATQQTLEPNTHKIIKFTIS